jgi:hypothetical protein
VFKNGVLREIVGHERDEVRGEYRSLHDEEVYVL